MSESRGDRPDISTRAREPALAEAEASAQRGSEQQVPRPGSSGRWRKAFFAVVLVLAATLGFLYTPYAGALWNGAMAFWGNTFYRQAERQAGAELEARGALVVYQTGTGNVDSVSYQGRTLDEPDLVPLMNLHRLLLLDLRDTNIADDDLRYLKNLTNLTTLVLSGTSITDQGLPLLTKMRTIEALHMTNTAITDQGLVHLKKLSTLAVLDLSETNVTDEGLHHLVDLDNLRWLLLRDTAVTDRGLDTLAAMKDLKRLTLQNTGVTVEGIRRFGQAVPGIYVDR